MQHDPLIAAHARNVQRMLRGVIQRVGESVLAIRLRELTHAEGRGAESTVPHHLKGHRVLLVGEFQQLDC